MFGLRGFIACVGTLANTAAAANANARHNEHSEENVRPCRPGETEKTSAAGTLTSEEVAICLSGVWIRVNGTLVRPSETRNRRRKNK